MATEYLNNYSNLNFANKIAVSGELRVPVFTNLADLQAYIPDGPGALAQYSTDMYRWTGAQWVLVGSGSGGGSSSTYRGSINDL